METPAPSGQSHRGLTLGSDRRKSVGTAKGERALDLQLKKRRTRLPAEFPKIGGIAFRLLGLQVGPVF